MSTNDLRRIFSDNVERPQSAYNGANSDKKMMTPLPTLQLFILLYLQLAEPLTSTVVYPFVNQLVRETGVTGGDERKTGYYAGLIVRLRFFCTYVNAHADELSSGIIFLCDRSHLRSTMGQTIRQIRPETYSALRSRWPHHFHSLLWPVEELLGLDTESMCRGCIER